MKTIEFDLGTDMSIIASHGSGIMSVGDNEFILDNSISSKWLEVKTNKELSYMEVVEKCKELVKMTNEFRAKVGL